MPYNIPRLELDLTGFNVDNLITNEPHTLSNRPVRSIAPSLGPFFSESMVVKDGVTILTKGLHYQLAELHQDLTLKIGKPVHSVVLIIDQSVSSTVTITYQAIGGHYCYSNESIANVYQSVINDSRPVPWANVTNKPEFFLPAIHRHLLEDVYGFEPVVDVLERIKRALTLGQTQVVLEIINSALTEFTGREPGLRYPSNKLMRQDAILYLLSRHKLLSKISVDFITNEHYRGRMLVFEIDTRTYPVDETLYWQFFKPNGNVFTLSSTEGSFVTNNRIIRKAVYLPTYETDADRPLYLGIKKNLTDTEYMALTYRVDIQPALTTDWDTLPYIELYHAGITQYGHVSSYTNDSDRQDVLLYFRLTD